MNIATLTMEKMTEMLRAIDNKYKEMTTEPYGVKKLTPAEQRKRIETLTPDELAQMVAEHGVDEVNEYISRFYKEGNNG